MTFSPADISTIMNSKNFHTHFIGGKNMGSCIAMEPVRSGVSLSSSCLVVDNCVRLSSRSLLLELLVDARDMSLPSLNAVI